jgi:hypothetical protein
MAIVPLENALGKVLAITKLQIGTTIKNVF